MTTARSRHTSTTARGSARGPFIARKRFALALSAVLLAASAMYSRGELAEAASTSPITGAASMVARAAGAKGDDERSVSVRLSEWKLAPSRLTVPTGEITFTVVNAGTMLHAFEVEGQGMEKKLAPLQVGTTATLHLKLPPGSYELYCPIGDGAHKKMGMIAHLEVLGNVDMKALIAGMKQGGYVVVFRHAPTNRDQADTDPLNYDDAAHQRLLSPKGREIAKQVGDAFRTLGIPIGTVYTSKYNRAVETGKLIGGGDVSMTIDVTEGGLVATPIENDRRTAALKQMAATAPGAGKNTVIVTHKPNLVDAFGEAWLSSKDADASVFKPDGSGELTLIARVPAADWLKAAKGS
jgi:phosphohistidine phosphatase SixA/plastocyanin